MIFDLKIGCVVTPRQLSVVFQYAFMRWKLGVELGRDTYGFEVERDIYNKAKKYMLSSYQTSLDLFAR